jgi:hypothetical protein
MDAILDRHSAIDLEICHDKPQMKLSKLHQKVLRRLIEGCTLKSHRYLDGQKIYKLHPLGGPPEIIDKTTIDFLKKHHLIDSNQKFPAATYLLTNKGQELATSLSNAKTSPLSAKNYVR